MTAMPDYFDEHRPCPKCWWSPPAARHCNQRRPYFSPFGGADSHEWIPVDHIHRECGRCGHSWLELPMDAKPMTQAEWEIAINRMVTAVVRADLEPKQSTEEAAS